MAYDPLSNYNIVRGKYKWNDDLYVGWGYTEAKCAQACDTWPECKNWVTSGTDPNNKRCLLEGANANSIGAASPDFAYGVKKAETPQDTYKGKRVLAPVTVQYGARPQDKWGGNNCGGFNGYGEWRGKRLQGFGTNYNGQCPDAFLLSYCPTQLGRPSSGQYSNQDGSKCNSNGPGCSGGDIGNNLGRTCNFSSLDMSKFINAGLFNDNLGTQILTDASWSQAKLDYCSQVTNIDKSECKNFFSDSRTGTSWNTVKLGFCAGASTGSDPTCLTTINNVFKSTLTRDDVNKQVASALVNNFCTANPTNDKCACWNATRNGYNCISDSSKSALPGCAALKRDFGNLPSSASVVSADTFCASNDCIGRALQDAVFMPAARAPSQTCPSIQACIQSFNNANLSGAQIDASCKQTLNIVTPPPPPPPPPPGAPPPPGTPSPAAAKDLLWPSSAVPGVDTKEKQIGLIAFIILCCCCCLLVLGFVVSSGGDSGGGYAAPNYSASIARLGSIASSL